jgi:hypothetical protein
VERDAVTRTVWLEGARVALDPAALLGQGGEAEVYDLGDGRALKWWKPADHPDFAGDPAAASAATARIAEHQRKLRAFPSGLAPAVIGPGALATATKRGGDVVGFAMRKVAGGPLYRLGEVKWRRDEGIGLDAVVAALLDLHATVTALHAADVVIGDFNDLNVLVDNARAYLIDADSFQLRGFPCGLYSHRFVDPRLCDPAAAAPVLVTPHDRDSDWFAFAVMAFRSLLGVGPYAGVHRPRDPKRAVAAAARSLRGVSVFDPDVVYPRAALPWSVLPDDTLAAFQRYFIHARRGAFSRGALVGLRFQRCAGCGTEHARGTCPVCATHVSVPVAVSGALRIAELALADVAAATWELGAAAPADPAAPPVWLAGDAIVRRTALGDERIGGVLARQTRAWMGATLGAGFYRAGGLTVGFVFRPDRRGVDDRVALPPIRGTLVRASAAIANRAWLAWTTALRGALATTLVAIDAGGRVIATHTGDGTDWLAGIDGACAAGDVLFVPTDDGVVRVEADPATRSIRMTRAFPDTRVAVAAGDALHLGSGGLDVVRGDRARRLHLT